MSVSVVRTNERHRPPSSGSMGVDGPLSTMSGPTVRGGLSRGSCSSWSGYLGVGEDVPQSQVLPYKVERTHTTLTPRQSHVRHVFVEGRPDK